MAQDGTGGIVYRKRVDGRAHVFAAQFERRAGGRRSASTSASASTRRGRAIGAGNGGRLVVTWVQEFGFGTDRLFSASLDPGARRFQAPVPIDLNVGEATGTYPSLAMNRGRQRLPRLPGAGRRRRATRTRRPATSAASCASPATTARCWSVLGAPADRNQAAPVATPTAGNSPKVGIDVTGNGIVAFQEPDDDFVDRVWARRLFGATLGIPLIVSPQQFGGAPLRGARRRVLARRRPASAQGAVALPPAAGPRARRLDGPHVFVNMIPEAFSDDAGQVRRRAARGRDAGGAARRRARRRRRRSDARRRLRAGVRPRRRGAHRPRAARRRSRRPSGSATAAAPSRRTRSSRSRRPRRAVAAWRARAGAGRHRRSARGRQVAREGRSRAGRRRRAGRADRGLRTSATRSSRFVQGDQGAAQIAAAASTRPRIDFAVQVPLKFVRSKQGAARPGTRPRNALGRVRYTVRSATRTVGAQPRRAASTACATRSCATGASTIVRDGDATATASVRRAPRPRCGSTASRRACALPPRRHARCGCGSSTARAAASRPARSRISFGRRQARARHAVSAPLQAAAASTRSTVVGARPRRQHA